MNLDRLLQALGYLRSERHWVTPETADPRLAHHYRLAQRAGEAVGEGAKVVGSYTYQTSLDDKLTPPRPVIFVAYAANDTQAQGIHKRLWNLGDCPFVLVVLPNAIRVYAGFNYLSDNPKKTLIAHESASLSDELPDSLLSFHADSIDKGMIWQQQAKYLGSETRVDYRLLKNLKQLSQALQHQHGLEREVAHALIGKYIYFRYLRDRGILDDDWLASHNVDPNSVFGPEANGQGFEALAAVLQVQFNGDIFPLPLHDNGEWRTNDAIPFLVGIFNGNTTYGQLALDFQVYDFSYIPVELLSSIYEQFLKAEGKGEGNGVVYTPEALADYVLAELEAVHPLGLDHKVLDPCCGSGVFLVLAYRRLIERLWHEKGERPDAEEMKALLQANIFGVEKDREACHIAAFSLILTLLSHLEPPELQANVGFQFPTLVGENLFDVDFFESRCPVFDKGLRFNWIAGNPPWTGADENNPDHAVAFAWINEAAKQGRKIGDRRLDEAFTWRASDLLHEHGAAGLLIKATTLVNSTSAEYRRGFFKNNSVRRITNLSNLRRILFMGPEGKRAEAPAACLIYKKSSPKNNKQPILHFGPFVADQLPVRNKGGQRRVWTITLYESDIQYIDYEEAEEDTPCLWKTALWGSYQDRRALRRLRRLLPVTVEDTVFKRGWLMCTGLHVKLQNNKSKSKFVYKSELEGKYILETDLLQTRFMITEEALPLLDSERQFIRERSGAKGLQLIAAPHILLTTEIAIYSDLDFVIPTPKVGIAADREDADYLKATALYLNSSVAQYANFFGNAQWGVSQALVNPKNMGAIPFIDLSPQQVKKLAETYDDLVEQERAYLAEHAPLKGEPLDLQNQVDAVIEEILQIPNDISVTARDFMRVRYQLLEGKTGDSASKPPSPQELENYAEQLRLQVDDFAQRHHRISVHAAQDAIIATVEVTSASEAVPVVVAQRPNTVVSSILNAVREQHSQWAYIQRSVRVFDGSCVHIVKAPRLLDWTQTQAVQDAADLIAQILERNVPRNERAAA